jgi:2-isopropylmalate synthase
MRPEVEIYDTTLRDGSQGEGVNFSVMDKLRIAERLDAFGVHYIEGGWPGPTPRISSFLPEARRRKFRRARLAAFGSTRRKGVAVEADEQVRLLLEAETPVVTIYGKTWLLHVKEVLRATPDENLAMIADTVRFLKDHGRFVIYDAEHGIDGFKDNPDYALATWQAAEKAGADIVVLCDTNGGSLPGEIVRATTAARGKLTTRIGIHTPQRHRARPGQCPGRGRGGRRPCARHHQRLRRTHRQLQPDQRHPDSGVQNAKADRARSLAAQTQRAVPFR